VQQLTNKLPRIDTFFVDQRSSCSDAHEEVPKTSQTTQSGSSNSLVTETKGSVSSDAAVETTTVDPLTLADSTGSLKILNDSRPNAVKSRHAQLDQTDVVGELIENGNDDGTGSSDMEFINFLSKENPSDMGHFNEDIDNKMKQILVDFGTCRPNGPFPKDETQKNRSFSVSYYHTISKAGLSIEVSWLAYSPRLDCAYCEPCWLFADRSDPHYHSAWSTGVRKWKELSQKIKLHSCSKIHIRSCMVFEQWKKHKIIPDLSGILYNREKHFWSEVLKRLIKITLMLAKNCLAFRGHTENIDDTYNGNFLSTVKLLAEFDPILNELLKRPNGTVKYLSPKIQNELIEMLGNALETNLVDDIKHALFFSIITDTTQDVSKIDQLSQTFRYVEIIKDDNGRPSEIKIRETFLGFYQCKSQMASDITNQIIEIVESKGLSFTQCRGQGYDGASTMSGAYGGVQKLIQDKQPLAVYVHCAAHNLNLVVNDAVSAVREVQAFFTTVQELYAFFGHSIRRWELLSSITGESAVTLKKLNPTRWAGRLSSLMGIKHRYCDVMKALTRIVLENKNASERNDALNLQKVMQTFEFVLILVVLTKVLSAINAASMCLQSKDADLLKATHRLKTAFEEVSDYRNKFSDAVVEATRICRLWGIEAKFKDTRVTRKKRHFDELAEDTRLTNAEQRFRITVFNCLIDTVTTQITQRFTAMHSLITKFTVIFPITLSSAPEDEIVEQATALQKAYSCDLSEAFPVQLVTLASSLKSEIAKLSSVKDLAHLLIVENVAMTSSFMDVVTALLLFLTLPVAVATAERSFSKLRLIKSYLRSTMGQDRLRALALLSIEAESVQSLTTDKLVENFASGKARRKMFF
jgi:Domain of unknown function (DUF4371)/hAT family C-terminal dimerisation region